MYFNIKQNESLKCFVTIQEMATDAALVNGGEYLA